MIGLTVANPLRSLGHVGGLSPSAPSLTAVDDGTGSSLTATVDGDASVTNTVWYRPAAGTAWISGAARTGGGDVTVSGLAEDTTYELVATSSLYGLSSGMSNPVDVTVTGSGSFPSYAQCLLAEFGEYATYTPAGGSARQIRAIVDRAERAVSGAGHGMGPRITVQVENHAGRGIALTEIDCGRDTVSVAVRRGETAQARALSKITNQDELLNMFSIEVR